MKNAFYKMFAARYKIWPFLIIVVDFLNVYGGYGPVSFNISIVLNNSNQIKFIQFSW